MLGTHAPRVAPAATGHDPQIDRLGGAIGTPLSTPGSVRDRKEYLLAELRCAALRTRLAACDIDAIGIALRGGMIDADTALQWLHDCGGLDYVVPTPQGGSSP